MFPDPIIVRILWESSTIRNTPCNICYPNGVNIIITHIVVLIKKSLWWMIVTKLCRQDFAFLNNLEIHLQELYRNQFERGPHTARRQNLLSIEGKIYILPSTCLRWPPTLSNLVACSSKMVVVLFVKKKSFCSKHGSDQLDISQLWNMERHLWHSLSKSLQWNVIVIHQAAFSHLLKICLVILCRSKHWKGQVWKMKRGREKMSRI